MLKDNKLKELIFIDIFILFINVYFNFVKNLFNPKKKEFFSLNINLNSFSMISHYLNNKYKTRNNKNKETIINKTRSIYFINFHEDSYHYNIINNIIKRFKKKFFININSESPDYLIYNIFGCKHLDSKYQNSIKIAYYTENQIPDFNTADYCIGHSHINYLDRYFKMPTYFINRLFEIKSKLFKIIRKKYFYIPIRKKFCAALITNVLDSDGFRTNFINELDKYKKVDMGGKYKNNVGTINNKIKFLSSYKFSIAMENTEGDGYVSEKIIDSFLSGTIPIYYGDYMIDEYINPEAFILIRGEKDMQKKIEYIKQIDNNDKIYINILKKNILNNKYIDKITINEFMEYLDNIISQNKSKAKRIDNFYNNRNINISTII